MSLNISGVVRIVYMDRKASSEGKERTVFSIANKPSFGDDEDSIVQCVAFGKTGDAIWQYFTVGSRIEVKDASLTIRKGQSKEGTEQYYTNLTINRFDFVDSKEESEKHFAKYPKDAQGAPAAPQQAAAPMAPAAPQQAPAAPQAAAPQQQAAAPAPAPAQAEFEDDIPF
jgi:single-stranded DNA-binding protein